MQRRKVNFQQPEYVQDNELINYGLSTHEMEEAQPTWTPKAIHDVEIVPI